MGWIDEFWKLYNESEQAKSNGNAGGGVASSNQKTINNREYIPTRLTERTTARYPTYSEHNSLVSNISNRMTVKSKKDEEKEERKWFQKGLFEDGYDFGDISRTILGTVADTAENVGTGIMGMGEKAIDALAWMAPAMENAAFYQNGGGYNLKLEKAHKEAVEASKKGIDAFIAKDLYDEEAVAKAIITNPTEKFLGINVEDSSVFGEKSDALIQSAGQLAAQYGLTTVGVPWFVTSGLTSFGSEAENALKQGATHEQAGASAAITAGAEVLSEKLFGGDLFVSGAGADLATKHLATAISNKTLRTLAKLGIDATGEGVEEVFSQVMSNLGSSLYKEEKLGEILFSEQALEEYIDSFVGGAALGGGMTAINVAQSKKQGVDYATGMTTNEQKVVEKVYNDLLAEKDGKVSGKEKREIYDSVINALEKGDISTDTIEEVLGGEDFSAYNALRQEANEFNALYTTESGKLSKKQMNRLAELEAKNEANSYENALLEAKEKISQNVFGLTKGSRLAESYYERGRKGQAFEADLTKYDDGQKAVIQKAVDSGILNNTRRTHEFVDMIARISADKGVLFDFTNNERLKSSGFALDGKTVNGYVSGNNITLNIQSAKALNSVVGHEISHVLEGTELYDVLRETVYNYAISKEGLDSFNARLKATEELYKGMDADADAELTADLIGDYLFTDTDFINRLSTENRNIFQKMYDEIKYLSRVATAGSKEARELEKVKKAFEDAYKATKNTTEDSGVKYSLLVTDKKGNATAVDPATTTREQTHDYLVKSRKGELDQYTYFPVRPRTPETIIATLQNDGIEIADKPLAMQAKKARQSQLEGQHTEPDGTVVRHHAMTPEEITETIDKLADPIVAIHQQDRMKTIVVDGEKRRVPAPDNFVFFVTLDSGKECVAVIEFDSEIDKKYIQKDGHGDDYHTTVTVFEPDQYRDGEEFDYYEYLLSKPSNRELDIKKESPKTETAISQTEATVSASEVANGEILAKTSEKELSTNNVAQEKPKVKGKFSLSDSNGNQLSVEQQKYFQDSKVRDDNGNLMVMYHGSPESFTVFDKKKAKYSGLYGKGFYFTNSDSHAKQYGNTYEVYLNITNPLQNGTNDITKDQLRKFVEAIAEDEDYGIENYGYEATVDSVTNNVFGKGDFAMLMDINVTCVGNMVEAIELFNKVNGTDYNGIIAPTETVAFYPEQIKEVTNQKPTSDPDIRYSLSEEGEQHPVYGNYNVYGSDIAYEGEPIQRTTEESSDIAPVVTSKMETTTPTISKTETVEDIAPIYESNDKSAPEGQTTMFEPVQEETTKKQTRKEYHQSIIDNIKSIFKTEGFDFDKVLKDARNLSTWSTVDNTPQRVMEKSLGYKEGGILADITVNKVAQNETEGIKWLNSFTDKDGLLAQFSKQYHIKPGSKESAAAQMYAEGFYVNENNEIVRYGDPELIQDFKNPKVRERIKGLARDPRIRQIYDETLNRINEARVRNGYPEIPRLDNYFLHFRAMEDTFSRLGLPFNPNDIRAKDLPTDLNGVTADLKPGQPFFASAMHRTGKRTSFDLLGGMERYLSSAKNQIYHIDDIQTLRALRNYIADTYGQANGLEGLDALSDAEAEERIKEVYNSHLSTFAKFLNEEANVLAGKTALIDRGLEGIIGRRGITFLNTLNRQVGSNMVGFNVSSSLTNFLPVAQTFAKTNKFDFTKAFAQTVANKLSGGRLDSFAEDSPVVIRRKGEERFYRTPWQKLADPGYALMGAVDSISTELIARTKYNELTRKGMDSQKAHFETDKWVSKLMGDRSLGQQPQLYNSKMLGLVTKFQLEVRNQLDSQFYDTIQETKVSNEHIQNGLLRNAKTAAKVTTTFVELAVVQHLFGKAFESMAGYNPAFDIIEVLMTAFGFDDDEESEDTALDNIEQGFMALMEDMPYASTFLEGGRIPISAALPIKEFYTGKDQYGNDKSRWETLGEVAPYYLMPGGFGQLKKTVQGLSMFSDEHPIAGSYTAAGNLRFPVEDTTGNRIKAGIFGQYASENARKYFDEEQRTLNPEQTEIFAGLNIPIEEYWDYRDKYNEFTNLKDRLMDAAYADNATDEDVIKGLYIDAVNDDLYKLYDQQKELAKGNDYLKQSKMRDIQRQMEQLLSESKYEVDNVNIDGYYATIGDKRFDYSDYSGRWYEVEGKYLKQEQAAVERYGVTPSDYWNNTDLFYQADYYFKYKPELENVSKNVFEGKWFANYAAEVSQIKGDDRNGDGKSDSGTKKKKVFSYIDSLDIDDIEKMILRKMSYPSEDKYNRDIVNYLNNRDDISYEDKKLILESLGAEVDSNGRIKW